MAYILLGHGGESITKPRNIVPEGCMLVVSEECGSLGTVPENILHVAQKEEYREWFLHPDKYKTELETAFRKTLHVYSPGDSYPTLFYSLFDEHGDGENVINVSGVWPLPAPPSIVLSPGSVTPYAIDGRYAWKAYSDAVFPRVAPYSKLDSLRKLAEDNKMTISQKKLFATFPGVYFNFLCRSIPELRTKAEHVLWDSHGDTIVFEGYNIPTTVRNLIRERNLPTATATNLAEMTSRIFKQRSASRSPTRKRHAEDFSAWNSLFNALITPSLYTPDVYLDFLSKIPLSQLNHTDSHNYETLLTVATDTQNEAVFKELLRLGANPNIQRLKGVSPLINAASWSTSAVSMLLDAGADPRLAAQSGSTALHFVTDPAMISLLVSHGANINALNNDNDTPLHTAISVEKEQSITVSLVNEFVRLGADTTIRNKLGLTPFTKALFYDMLDVAKLLAPRKHTDIDSTLLTLVMENNADTTAAWLVRSGIIIPERTWISLLNSARRRRMPRLVAALKKRFAKTFNLNTNTSRTRKSNAEFMTNRRTLKKSRLNRKD